MKSVAYFVKVWDKKILWLVLDNYFSFTEDKKEWIGNKIIFEITEDGKKRKLPTSELDNSKKVLLNECGDICGVYCTFNLSLFKKISDILKAKWHDKKDMSTISINDLPKLISYLDLNNIFWEFQLNWNVVI